MPRKAASPREGHFAILLPPFRTDPDETMNQRGYLRQPTIAGDAIVFVCDDDLLTVGSTGGIARCT